MTLFCQLDQAAKSKQACRLGAGGGGGGGAGRGGGGGITGDCVLLLLVVVVVVVVVVVFVYVCVCLCVCNVCVCVLIITGSVEWIQKRSKHIKGSKERYLLGQNTTCEFVIQKRTRENS